MVDSYTVKSIFEQTREFYQNGVKSNNKCYHGEESKMPPTSRFFNWKLSKKQKLRNETVRKTLSSFQATRNSYAKPGDSLLSVGTTLHSTGNNAGNCGEMACVALHIAIENNHVPVNDVKYCQLDYANAEDGRSFNHTFIAIGTEEGEWIVDPWANVCCKTDEYADQVTAKMKKWNKEGKRLQFVQNEKPYWGSPEDPIMQDLIAPMCDGQAGYKFTEPETLFKD